MTNVRYQAQYYPNDKGPHVFIQENHDNEERNNEGSHELSSNKGNQKPKHRVQYRKGKKKLDKRIEPEGLPDVHSPYLSIPPPIGF